VFRLGLAFLHNGDAGSAVRDSVAVENSQVHQIIAKDMSDDRGERLSAVNVRKEPIAVQASMVNQTTRPTRRKQNCSLTATISIFGRPAPDRGRSPPLELITLVAGDNLKHQEENAAKQRKSPERGNRPIVLMQTDYDQHDAEQQKKGGCRFLDEKTFPYITCHVESPRCGLRPFTQGLDVRCSFISRPTKAVPAAFTEL
jgi:hypothetical protein